MLIKKTVKRTRTLIDFFACPKINKINCYMDTRNLRGFFQRIPANYEPDI